MKITIAQLNPTVGDIPGNVRLAESIIRKAAESDSGMIVFPELFISGYPPRDLLERSWFIEQADAGVSAVCEISSRYSGLAILMGSPRRTDLPAGKGLANSAVLISQGKVLFEQHKSLLPTYDVFDEARYFDSHMKKQVFRVHNEILGITICEDAWNVSEMGFRRVYDYDPVGDLVRQGATLLINISASPFHAGKERIRFRIMQHHAQKHRLPFVFVNQTGGNDELIFDGRSMLIDPEGRPAVWMPAFTETVEVVDTAIYGSELSSPPVDSIQDIHSALCLGIRDYLRKCGFKTAVIGLSGGIDSAVTCALAVESLGSQNVTGVTMPGPFSSQGSIDDSRSLASNLGIRLLEIPITPIYEKYLSATRQIFTGLSPDTTEENIQARIRGNILMAVSNKFGSIVLTTGNKSELAMGYCTLYGDMSGGLAVISDVPKTMVYQLARHINGSRNIIPELTMTKPPSAELRPDQTDQDTLPPYEILDQIIEMYLDEDSSCDQIIGKGFDPETVRWVLNTINRNEFKRKQAAPGLKITSKAFGIGRRMPVAARIYLSRSHFPQSGGGPES